MTCVIWKLASVCLETELVLVQDSTQFAPNASYAKKPFWMHPMILMGKGAQVEAQFAFFGYSANIDVR